MSLFPSGQYWTTANEIMQRLAADGIVPSYDGPDEPRDSLGRTPRMRKQHELEVFCQEIYETLNEAHSKSLEAHAKMDAERREREEATMLGFLAGGGVDLREVDGEMIERAIELLAKIALAKTAAEIAATPVGPVGTGG